MKKTITLLLTLALITSLTACGGKNTSNGTGKSSGGKSSSQSEKQSEVQSTTPNTPADKNPEGYSKYVNQGAVVYYPTDTWKKGDVGGIVPIDSKDNLAVVRLGVSQSNLDEAIEIFKSDYSGYKSVEKMKIADHDAAKCVYVGKLGTHMEIIFDTPYTNDEFYRSCAVRVYASEDNVEFFDDPTVLEIIESFYFDRSLKYSF